MLAAESIVNPHQIYSYKVMQRDMEKLAEAYPDLISYESLGQTKYGRHLWAMKIGRGESVLFLNGSHHAREWLTTPLLMKMLDTYAAAYYNNTSISKYQVRDLLDKVSIWVVPMVNPDGVTLSQQGTAGLTPSLAKLLKKYNGNSTNFNHWKANMEGIDLNRQYPASWNTIRNSTSYPWYQNYKGKQPAQAKEVQMLMDFTYRIDPEVTVSYHSSGEILFWHFNTLSKNVARDKAMAIDLGNLTGYSLVRPEKNPSGGGYKDWFVQQFGRPGFTIEIGDYAGERSLPLSQFNTIWNENREVGLYTALRTYNLWLGKQKVQSVSQSLSLLGETSLYSYPGAKIAISSVSPQVLAITAQKGDWYEVSSDMGTGWVHPAPGMLTSVELLNGTALLQEAVLSYQYPDPFAPKISTVTPQTVQVTGRWEKWLLIHTESGDQWIDGHNIEVQESTAPATQ